MDKINASEFSHKVFGTVEFIDDFMGLDTTTWLTTLTDSGTIAEDQDGQGGTLTFTASDGTVADNDEVYLYTNEWIKFRDGKPFSILGRLQYAEVATNVANILFGIGEGFGVANTLQDNGGGPPSDYDGACVFKVDGETRWRIETSFGTAQTTDIIDYTAGGSSFVCFQIDCIPLSSTEMKVNFWIDPLGGINLQPARFYNANYGLIPRLPLATHRFAYSTVGEMAACFGVKNGSAANQTMDVDLFGYIQKR